MFCKKCGKPTGDGQVLCDACAAAQNPQPEQPTVAPVWQPAPPAQPAAPQSAEPFDLNVPTDVTPVKKKKKGGLIAAIVAAIVVILGVAAVVAWPYLSSFFNRTFSSADSYAQSVEDKALSDEDSYISALGDLYGAFLKSGGATTSAARMDLRLKLGNELIGMLESASGDAVDLDWLEHLLLSVDYNVTEDGMQLSVGAGLNDKHALTADMIMDISSGIAYIGVPVLNETYVAVDYDDLGLDLESIMNQSLSLQSQLVGDLPSQDEFEDMLTRYIKIVTQQLENVEKESDTVEISDISQSLTVLETKITGKDTAAVVKAVLEEAKDDKVLRQFVVAYCDYMNAYYDMVSSGYGSSYPIQTPSLDAEQILAAIPDALDELDEADFEMDGYLVLKTYVDGKDHIQGRVLAFHPDDGDPQEIGFITVRDGDDFACKLVLPDEAGVSLTGSGTEKKDVINGSFTLRVRDEQALIIDLEDFDTKTGTGKLRLAPGDAIMEELLSEMDSTVSSFIGNAGLALELDLRDSGLSLSVVSGSNSLITLDVDAEEKKPAEIVPPTVFVYANDEMAMQNWLNELDIGALLDALEDCGVPSSLIGSLQGALSSPGL